jgi:hypothetical protein
MTHPAAILLPPEVVEANNLPAERMLVKSSWSMGGKAGLWLSLPGEDRTYPIFDVDLNDWKAWSDAAKG